jgi:hypothetical protein
MRTNVLVPGGAIVAMIAWLNAAPYALAQPWDAVWHLLAYASLTMLAWIGADGRRPLALTGGVMLLGACLSDLAAAAPAAALTSALLFFLQGKQRACAESSQR